MVLDEGTVDLITEIVGTVRGWSAQANAGRRKPVEPPAQVESEPATAEQRLLQLDDLHKKGLLGDDEFRAKRAVILDDL